MLRGYTLRLDTNPVDGAPDVVEIRRRPPQRLDEIACPQETIGTHVRRERDFARAAVDRKEEHVAAGEAKRVGYADEMKAGARASLLEKVRCGRPPSFDD